MNDIIFSNTVMPVLSMCDLCAASEPFFHADRITDFYVLIYVIEGTIYVTEEAEDYAVGAGELLFLKKVYIISANMKFLKGRAGIMYIFTWMNLPKLKNLFPIPLLFSPMFCLLITNGCQNIQRVSKGALSSGKSWI